MKIFSDEFSAWNKKHKKVKKLAFILSSIFFALSIAYAADKAFFIDASGNVGIGTDKPTKTLDVNGDTKVTGNLHIDEGVIFGKINVLGTWEITNDDTDSVRRREMIKMDNGVCFLTSVYGDMNSDKTIVAILKGTDERITSNPETDKNYWYLYRKDEGKNKVKASAICIGKE